MRGLADPHLAAGGVPDPAGLAALGQGQRAGVVAHFFFSSRRRHTSCGRDWSSDVCSSDLLDRYEAQTAERWGLVNEVVPAEALLPTALDWGRRIASYSPTALRFLKHSFNADTDHIGGLSHLAFDGLELFAHSDEGMEGARAFAEKREPEFVRRYRGCPAAVFLRRSNGCRVGAACSRWVGGGLCESHRPVVLAEASPAYVYAVRGLSSAGLRSSFSRTGLACPHRRHGRGGTRPAPAAWRADAGAGPRDS